MAKNKPAKKDNKEKKGKKDKGSGKRMKKEAVIQAIISVVRSAPKERFCYKHGGKISGGYVQNYGYIVETEHYRYCLRCNPSPGDYNCYCTAYDLDAQRQNMAQSTGPDMTMGGLT